MISSGAATNAYSGWSAYSASKAAINSLAQSLAVEETEITSLAIRPGVVDTEMQNDIRSKRTYARGVTNVDGDVMGHSHEKFVQLKEEGKLLSPDTVGKAIAGMAVCENEKIHEFSGKFVNWDDNSLSEILV